MEAPGTESQKSVADALDKLIRQRRAQAYNDALTDARARKLNETETNAYLISATTNALWDAQDGRQYRVPVYYPKTPVYNGPVYNELEFLKGKTLQKYFAEKR